MERERRQKTVSKIKKGKKGKEKSYEGIHSSKERRVREKGR